MYQSPLLPSALCLPLPLLTPATQATDKMQQELLLPSHWTTTNIDSLWQLRLEYVSPELFWGLLATAVQSLCYQEATEIKKTNKFVCLRDNRFSDITKYQTTLSLRLCNEGVNRFTKICRSVLLFRPNPSIRRYHLTTFCVVQLYSNRL